MSSAVRRIVAAMAVVALSACGGEGESGQVGITSITEDVNYYPGCQNEPVEIDGTVWYPLAEFSFPDRVADITKVPRQSLDVGPVGFRSARVAEPGPGDDTGTLVVFEDGYARYETDSGLGVWMTEREQTYDWVC